MMVRSVGLVNGELDNTEAKQHNMTVNFLLIDLLINSFM